MKTVLPPSASLTTRKTPFPTSFTLNSKLTPDDEVSAGDSIGTIESVKAAAEVHFPVSGTVLEVNEEVVDTPEMLNQEPYEGGWLVKVQVSDESELDALMDAAAYEAYCQDR